MQKYTAICYCAQACDINSMMLSEQPRLVSFQKNNKNPFFHDTAVKANLHNVSKQTSIKPFHNKFIRHHDSLCRNAHLNINHDDRAIEV